MLKTIPTPPQLRDDYTERTKNTLNATYGIPKPTLSNSIGSVTEPTPGDKRRMFATVLLCLTGTFLTFFYQPNEIVVVLGFTGILILCGHMRRDPEDTDTPSGVVSCPADASVAPIPAPAPSKHLRGWRRDRARFWEEGERSPNYAALPSKRLRFTGAPRTKVEAFRRFIAAWRLYGRVKKGAGLYYPSTFRRVARIMAGERPFRQMESEGRSVMLLATMPYEFPIFPDYPAFPARYAPPVNPPNDGPDLSRNTFLSQGAAIDSLAAIRSAEEALQSLEAQAEEVATLRRQVSEYTGKVSRLRAAEDHRTALLAILENLKNSGGAVAPPLGEEPRATEDTNHGTV